MTLSFSRSARRALLGMLLASLSALMSCSLGGGVRITGTNFAELIEPSQNLVFTFNESLASSEDLGRWDTTQYIRFTPAVSGRFQWTAQNELTFSPSGTFAASTDYTASPTSALLRDSANRSYRLASADPVKFHTPYLDFKQAEGRWELGANGQPAASVRVEFNYPVDADALKKLLTVKVGTRQLAARVKSTGAQASHTLELGVLPEMAEGKDYVTVEINVAAGLRCAISEYVTKENLRYSIEFASKPTLSVTSVEAETVEGATQLRIFTTQAVPNNGLARFITLSPEVGFTAEATEYGIRLLGTFDPLGTYSLTISENLTGVLGTRLGQAYEQTVSFAVKGKAIQFESERGQVLSAAGARNVAVRILGVDKVQVRMYKIYENNLLAFNRQGMEYEYGEYSEADGEYHSTQRYSTEAYGDLLWERDVEARSLPLHGGIRLLNVPTEDRRKDFKGVYVLEVVSKDQFWVRASKVITVSDIGLMARRGGGEILVFAHNLLDASPIGGAKLTLWSTNNQAIAEAQTDGSGVAKFESLDAKAPGFRYAMITATKAGAADRTDDFTHLMLSRPIETSRYDVSGKVTAGKVYDAFVYGEREIYRPGDSLRLNCIVRSYDWQAVIGMPVKLKLVLPTGRELTTLRGELGKNGAWDVRLLLPPTAMTGSYTAELYSGSDELLGSRTLSVEEFVPDRIKVTAKLSPETIAAGATVTLRGTAVNLYGPPATGRAYKAELSIKQQTFAPDGFDAYDFSLRSGIQFEPVLREGTTDAQGLVGEQFGPFADLGDAGLLQGTVLLTVLDETNRPVGRSAQFTLATQPVLYGLRRFDAYQPLRQPMTFAVVGLTPDGKPAKNAAARVVVVRKVYDVVLERNYGTYRYRSQMREQVVSDRLVQLTASGATTTYTATQSGQYELRVYKPGALRYVGQEFYAYGWDSGQTANYEIDPEGRVIIEADKASYQTDETAELLFKAPFDGRMIVTIERERVSEHHVLEVKDGNASLRLPIRDAFLPNVYVTATLIRGLNGPPLPLTVAHGYRSLKVEKADRKLALRIEAAEKSTSRRKQTILVHTEPWAEVTIAAVDEGILQIMNTKTPDPYAHFYGKRALEVIGYDLYDQLLPELALRKSSTGGDKFYEQGDRANPLSNKRIKLVSFWNSRQIANKAGTVSFDIELPAFSGQVRVMAVAYKGNAFGSAEHRMIVADPVVISAGLPRFMSPGDTVVVPVTLANTTTSAMNAAATLKATGPLRVVGTAQSNVRLAANGEARASFTLVASQNVGEGSAEVVVNAGGGTYSDRIDMTVRPAAGFIPLTGSGQIDADKSATVDLSLPELIPATRRARLVLSRSPAVQLGRDLSFLLGYPHGCIEQTVSKAFPQIYYTELSRSLAQPVVGTNTSTLDVRAAIAKLQTMQLPDGSLSYWPGGDYSSAWGSVYAAHFLHEAERAGYDPSRAVQQRLDDYLVKLAGTHNLEQVWFYDQGTAYATLTRREILYALYVLALRGKPQVARMNFYKARPELLTGDSKYLLSAAYALTGDQAAAGYLLPQALGKLSRAESGGSFGSPLRDQALALLMLLDVNSKHSQVPVLARALSQGLRDAQYLSTQEAAWGFLALGKLSRATESQGATGSISLEGKSLGELPKTGDLAVSQGIAGKKLSVKAEGGTLYYFWQGAGIGTGEKVDDVDNGIRVRRSYYDRKGSGFAGTTFNQNDLIVVKVQVELTGSERLENVVITDLLPAGLEIENPRIREVPGLDWVKSDTPKYLDLRDDRVNFYTDLYRGRVFEFAYVVRAVTQGTYRQGPVTADAMYRPEVRSVNGAGVVRVGPPR